MRNLKILLFLAGLQVSSIAYSQSLSPDTSKYTAPTWKVRILIQTALQAVACDSLVTQQSAEINRSIKYEESQDSLLVIKSREIVVAKSDARNSEDRYKNQVVLTGVEKRKKRKWFGATVVMTVLFIIQTVSK